MTPLENANAIEIAKLKQQNEKMKKLASRTGFFQMYFLECKNHNTNKEAFDFVNEEYFELFGQYRYADYSSFKNISNYYHKKSK